MKNVCDFKNVIAVILLITVPFFAHAKEGGAGPGGGDVLRSSVQEVNSELSITTPSVMLRSLEEIRLELKQPNGAIFQIADPTLRKIFSQMIGSATDIYQSPLGNDIKNTKINVDQDHSCVDIDGKKKPMSVKSLQLGSDLCISVPELRKYPATTFDLSKQIEALYFHEFTHHLGYGETEAKLVQNFVLRKFFGPLYPSSDVCRVEFYLAPTADVSYERIKLFPKDLGWSFGVAHGSTGLFGQVISIEREEDVCPNCNGSNSPDLTSEILTKTKNLAPSFEAFVSKAGSFVKFNVLDHTHRLQTIQVKWGALTPTNPNDPNDPWLHVSNASTIGTTGTLDGKPVNVSDIAVRSSCFYTK